ncbi:MAG: PA2169 family four-helix-bundle protein [Bacteroidetes bacterium]|nr:PA2169 family four-helix-bundle protein [Bacteroidota bacterium]
MANPYSKIEAKDMKTLSVLNDLIRINIDRITAYEKAAHAGMTGDSEARDAFYKMATESRSYVNDLHAEVIRMGGAPVTESTITGKLYLHWLNGKTDFRGETLAELLEDCKNGEEAMQEVYRHALSEEVALPKNVHELVERQLWGLERACEKLGKMMG